MLHCVLFWYAGMDAVLVLSSGLWTDGSQFAGCQFAAGLRVGFVSLGLRGRRRLGRSFADCSACPADARTFAPESHDTGAAPAAAPCRRRR